VLEDVVEDKRHRRAPGRRRVERGGRRKSDRIALTPELQLQAAAHAAEIERCLAALDQALQSVDVVLARAAAKDLFGAADRLRGALEIDVS
jgi:hypothetical protein